MARMLIAYGTSDGHTAEVAASIADLLRSRAHEARAVELGGMEVPVPEEYDGVIVGASVHRGRHQAAVERFVRLHRETLGRRATGFFSVSLALADGSADGRREAERYVDEFVRRTGWRPGMVACVAGALRYSRYGWLERWIMQRIARYKGSPDTDTSRDYVYTDWRDVKRFAEELAAAVETEQGARTGPAPAWRGVRVPAPAAVFGREGQRR